MSETAISLKTKALHEEAEKNAQNFEFICENEGFRYYKDVQSGRQCCLDSAGFWYVLNEEKGTFEPMASNFVAEKQNEKPRPRQDKMQSMLKNVERFGIRFDQHGKPVFPKNEKGHFILPKDEKGSPFFPVDDRSVPIFPWDYEKGVPTFPVDDTDEPIFPRNDQNKPIVPVDENDQPIFPMDKSGTFIFPVDESNCPIPALTVYGTRVVPKDEFGNAVIPRDRDGKSLIHIASDGITPLSMSEWKQWKKYYKEQAHLRSFYQQRQQQQQPVTVEATAAGIGIGAANYSAMNSMFHPLNLEQQSAYFAADMEMLQRVRRVRPEDVDLPGQMVGLNSTADQNAKQMANGQTLLEDREEKRKKLLKAQLKSAKMVVPPAQQIPKKPTEEPKKNGVQSQKEEPKKDNGKKQQQTEQKGSRESTGESGKRGIGSVISRESGKRAIGTSRKRSRETSRESSEDGERRLMRRSTRSSSVKRLRRGSSSSSDSSTSRSRSRSRSSRSHSYRRSPKRSPAADRRRNKRHSTSYSSRSRSSSSSSSVTSSSHYSSSERSRSRSRSYTSDRDEEEERIRDRIIARTLSTSAAVVPAKPPQPKDDGNAVEAIEYGPKPPESLEHSTPNSDMEMSEEDEKEKQVQQQQQKMDLPKDNQRLSLNREPSFELLNNMSEKERKEREKASPPKKSLPESVSVQKMAPSQNKVQPQSVTAPSTQLDKTTDDHRTVFTVEEALVSGDIEVIKQCKEKEREKYDQLKLQIAELVMKKSVHKWNWTRLREAEKRVLGWHADRPLSESSEDEAK